MKAKVLLCFGVFTFCVAAIWAQDTGTAAKDGTTKDTSAATDQKTVEDVYLQSSVEIQVIKSLAAETERGDKLQALESVEKMIANGKASGKAPELVSILDDLASEGVTKEIRLNGRIINDYPEVRQRAAEALGKLGGEKARDSLINISLKDPEPMVVASSVYALGQLATNDDHKRIETIIANLAKTQDNIKPDNNFALAVVFTYKNMAEKFHGKLDPAVFEVLIRIQRGNYLAPVRDEAKKLLDKLVAG